MFVLQILRWIGALIVTWLKDVREPRTMRIDSVIVAQVSTWPSLRCTGSGLDTLLLSHRESRLRFR